jgi:hypothetical protein
MKCLLWGTTALAKKQERITTGVEEDTIQRRLPAIVSWESPENGQ